MAETARERFHRELLELLETIHVSASGRQFTEETRTKVADAVYDLTSSFEESLTEDYELRRRPW